MATVTYYFDSYDTGTVWSTTPANMADGSTGTSAATTTDNDVELLDGNTCAGTDLGTITDVELRVYGRKQNGSRQGDIIARPVFSGGDGDNHTYSPGTSGAWSGYFDISSDTNAPGTWAWSDVSGLECDIEFLRGLLNAGYCAKVEIRVTYTPGAADQDITPSHISSAATVYEPTVSAGAVTISPDHIASTEAVYDPTVTIGAVTISPDHIASTATVYELTITTGAVTIAPDHIASTEAVYEPRVAFVALQDIAPDHIASTEAMYAPVMMAIPDHLVVRVLPDDRIIDVPEDDRIYVVRNSKTITTSGDPRTIKIHQDPRTITD